MDPSPAGLADAIDSVTAEPGEDFQWKSVCNPALFFSSSFYIEKKKKEK